MILIYKNNELLQTVNDFDKQRILSMQIKLQHSKDVKASAKTSQFSSLNGSMIRIKKEDSKHTKPSLHINSHSANQVPSVKKPHKQKKNQAQTQQKKNKTIRSTELMTSGRSKQIKLKIKNKKSCDFQTFPKYQFDQIQQSGQISYREYCLVENSFVPIVSKNEQQKLQEIMQSTADTTHLYEDFNRTTFRNVFPFKLKDSNPKVCSNGQISRISEGEESIFVKRDKKPSKREVQIEASPFYEEVGIQYSERPQYFMIQKQKQQKPQQIKAVEIDIQTDLVPAESSPVKNLDSFIEQPKTPKQQSLSDLLIKLEFKHLPNEKAFEQMSKQEKEHYSQLLTSLISKLSCSPRQKEKQIHPIKTKQMIQIEQVNLIPPLEEIKIQYAKLEMEIAKRQSSQMSWIHTRSQPSHPQEAFDTSMLAVSSFLLNFFCYIELNYMEEFLQNIQKQYGPSYFSEYLRLTRGLKIESNYDTVLDEGLFDLFCQQLKEIAPLEKHHLRSIFDYVNELLDTYRPSFHHKGEPFPWSLRMYKSICQYVIDESSMEVIFIETKENIEQAASMLCGLIVDESLYKDISEINPLALKRSYKQNVLIDMWLKQDGDDTHSIECQVTKVFAQISNQLYDTLLLELLNEIPFQKML